jgi:hypothetical protein
MLQDILFNSNGSQEGKGIKVCIIRDVHIQNSTLKLNFKETEYVWKGKSESS